MQFDELLDGLDEAAQAREAGRDEEARRLFEDRGANLAAEVLAQTDDLINQEAEGVARAYDRLLVRLGAFPWTSEDGRAELAFAREALAYFLAAERAGTSIVRQVLAAMEVVRTRSPQAQRRYEKYGAEAEEALDRWIAAIRKDRAMGMPGEVRDLGNAENVARKYGEVLVTLKRALALKDQESEAKEIILRSVWPMLDGYLLPKITKAYDEFRMDVDFAHNEVASRAVSAAVQGIAGLCILSLLVTALAVALQRGLVRSVSRLAEGARKVGGGDLDHRVIAGGRDELSRVADAFNRMAVELRQTTVSRDFVDNIVRSMGEGLAVLDPDGKVERVNRAFLDLAGVSTDEAEGRSFREFLPLARQDVFDAFVTEWSGKGTVFHETVLLSAGAAEVQVSLSLSSLAGREGGAVIILKDMTQRKRWEQELLLTRDRLRSLAAELTLVEERERRRMATVLHDDLGQRLALGKIKLASLLAQTTEKEVREGIEDLNQTLEDCIRETRSLTFDLSPPILYELGFTPGVEWLCEKISAEHDLEVTFNKETVDLR
jgi:PAS domain S-box-containing protein